MRLLEHRDSTIPPSPPVEPDRIISLLDRRPPATGPYDDLRHLTVVVWARAKLIERRLDGQSAIDPRLLAGLADIETAVTEIGLRLDALEDTQTRLAA